MNTLTVLLNATPWWLSDVISDIVACVLIFSLPILIAILIYRRKVNDTNKRAEVALAALEKNNGIVPEELMKSLNKPQKSLKERLLGKLMWGILCSVSGVGLIIAAVVEYCSNNGVDEFDADSLVFSGILLALGIGFLVYYFVGRRMLAKEIEAEEKEKV